MGLGSLLATSLDAANFVIPMDEFITPALGSCFSSKGETAKQQAFQSELTGTSS